MDGGSIGVASVQHVFCREDRHQELLANDVFGIAVALACKEQDFPKIRVVELDFSRQGNRYMPENKRCDLIENA